MFGYSYTLRELQHTRPSHSTTMHWNSAQNWPDFGPASCSTSELIVKYCITGALETRRFGKSGMTSGGDDGFASSSSSTMVAPAPGGERVASMMVGFFSG